MLSIQRRARRGFTLPELLVSILIFSLMSAAVFQLYFSSLHTFRHGTTRLDLQQSAREIMNRVHPILVSAQAPTPTEDAIYSPTLNTYANEIGFYSTRDFFTGIAFDPRNPVIRRYILRFVPGPGNTPGTLRLVDATNPANSKTLGRRIRNCRFERVGQLAIQCSLTMEGVVRDAKGRSDRSGNIKTFTIRSVMQLPSM